MTPPDGCPRPFPQTIIGPFSLAVATTRRIAGAGPAGLAAAIALARRGEDVEVLERSPHLGSWAGNRTEGLRNYGPTDALAELRGHGVEVVATAMARRTVRRTKSHRNVLHGPAYYLLARGSGPGSLEGQLFEQARAAGVKFRFNMNADPADVDIVATGSPLGVRSLLGVGFTFTAEGSRVEPDVLYALLDNDYAPGGYVAIAPGPEAHSFYSVSWADLDPQSLRRRIAAALELPWVRELLGSSRRVGEIEGGAWYTRDPVSTAVDPSGALRVGEAGGFQDAVAGYGLRYALLTGALAAQALVDGRDYRALLRETFRGEFEEAYALREKLNVATNEDLDRLVASMGPEMTLDEYRDHRDARLI